MMRKFDKKFDQISKYPWFQHCGSQAPSRTCVGSWDAAVKESKSNKWKNSRLMAKNALARYVRQKDWYRGEEWNGITGELRSMIEHLINDLTAKTKAPLDQIKPGVLWDIMLICMECEYEDLVKPIFYLPLLDPWYAAGRFPCGWTGKEFPEPWDGTLPKGEVIVF